MQDCGYRNACWKTSFWASRICVAAACFFLVVASQLSSAQAGTITFTSPPSLDPVTVVSGSLNNLQVLPGTFTDLSTGFTLNDTTFTYTADANDVNQTVEFTYTASRTFTFTAGTYIDLIKALIFINFPPNTELPIGGINAGTTVGNMPGTGIWVDNSVPIPSGTLPIPFVGSATSTPFTLSGTGSSSLVQTVDFKFTPTAEGQVFIFKLPVTSEIIPVPEPATGLIALGLGLLGMIPRARVRWKTPATNR